MRRILATLALLATGLAVAGCGTKTLCVVPPATDPGPADTGTTTDVPVADVADPGTPDADDATQETIVPASYVPAGSFRFRGAGMDGDAYRVEVVARDLPAAFGIALRVEWDPASLSLVSAVPEPVLGDEGAGEAIYKAAQVRPGSLALGLAHLYYDANTALEGDVVVATLVLKSLDGRPAGLRFYAPRCLVLDSGRSPIVATYLPSTLQP